MDQLANQYRQLAWILFGVATACVGLVYKFFDPQILLCYLPPWLSWLSTPWVSSIVTNTTIYGLAYLGILRWYKNRGWTWLSVNKPLDCRGKWFFRAYRCPADPSKPREQLSSGTAHIHQTALTFRIEGNSDFTLHWQVRSIKYNNRLQGFLAYTALPRDLPQGCLDAVCGIARFGPDYDYGDPVKGNPTKPPKRLVFVCHEMPCKGKGMASREYDLLEIVYVRDVEDFHTRPGGAGGASGDPVPIAPSPSPKIAPVRDVGDVQVSTESVELARVKGSGQ